MSPRPQKPEPPGPSAADLDAIALVLAKRHRRRPCYCEYCRAIERVCRLAKKHINHTVAAKRAAWNP